MRRLPRPMRKVGPKGQLWNTAWRAAKKRLVALKVRACEFGFEGCRVDDALTPAHAVKRRYLRDDAPLGSPEHIETVAICCIPCHRILDEQMSHADMEAAVMGAIARRRKIA